MGIHSGPVSEVTDVNGRTNIAGAGINMAQRVMDCGDAGHILLSQHVADDLVQYREWSSQLHDLGECEVKHGLKLRITNLVGDDFGNVAMPARFAVAMAGQKARRTARQLKIALSLAVVLAAGIILLRLGSQPASIGPAAVAAKSIAVLPFENLSEEKSSAYFASGMRDEILTDLAQLADLKVISRNSAGKYQSHPDDLKEVSRQLGVATVLEGSVQRSGDDLLINVQLIDTQSDNHLWAQSYERKLKNIFEVEAEVAEKVAAALKVKLEPGQAQHFEAARTTSTLAHDLYFRARVLGDRSDEQSLEDQIALLNQALKLDPHYANAWAGIASAYMFLADAYRAPVDIRSPAQHAALMAIASDDKTAAGHMCLGGIALVYDWNFPLAKRELERAIALEPNSSEAHRWHGWYLARVDRNYLAARAELEQARILDPLSTWVLWAESAVTIAQRDYGAALRLAEQIMDLDPHFFYDEDPVAHVFVAMERWPEAVKRYESLPASTFRRPSFELAICYAHTGDLAHARQILEELEALAQRRYVDHTHIAAIDAAVGDKDAAFAALDQACKDRSARIGAPRFYPWLGPLFGDPRFSALENRVAHSVIVLPENLQP